MSVKRQNFRSVKWSDYIALTNKLLFYIEVSWYGRDLPGITKRLKKSSQKDLFQAVTETIVGYTAWEYRVLNSLCNFPMIPWNETTRVWLLRLYWPDLTKNGGINGFGQSIDFSHSSSGVSKLRPAGQIRPAKIFYQGRGSLFKKHIHSLWATVG